jgi:pyrroline-5-carboxylate reductase
MATQPASPVAGHAASPEQISQRRLAVVAVDERKIAVLGAGQIGEALIAGLLSSGWRSPGEIVASNRRPERAAELTERYGISALTSSVEAAENAALVVIAVKPQDVRTLLEAVGPQLTTEQTVLSIVAAIPTSLIERHLAPGVPVVRAMPNTPSMVHEGIAGLCPGSHSGDAHITLAEEALAHLGAVVRVPESSMDAVTAVSGSGPAYFALLAEAMIEAGLLLGITREVSTQLVIQTMLGTAKQLRDGGLHPVELREMVTSPGGTTIAAIHALEVAGVRAAFLNAIQAAMTRARELAAEQD